MTLTLDAIESIARAVLPAHLVTASATGGEQVSIPGCQMYLDESDPNSIGWAYREAQRFDADTMEWNGEESGPVDSEADVRALVERAAARIE